MRINKRYVPCVQSLIEAIMLLFGIWLLVQVNFVRYGTYSDAYHYPIKTFAISLSKPYFYTSQIDHWQENLKFKIIKFKRTEKDMVIQLRAIVKVKPIQMYDIIETCRLFEFEWVHGAYRYHLLKDEACQ